MIPQQPIHNSILNMFQNASNQMQAEKPKATKPGKKIFKYPFISSQDFKKSMDNYENFVQNYNNSLQDRNQDVKDYNKLVDAMMDAKKVDKKHAKFANKLFSKQNNPLFVVDYNDFVEYENKKHACPVYKKREYQTVKWQSKLFFKAILGFYSAQIKRNNTLRLQATGKAARPLEMVVLDSNRLANAQKESLILNDAHKKTFQRHIKRFREAGILTDYVFVNANKPVYYFINSEILAISDHNPEKSSKTQNAENQLFISEPRTKCADNNHTTRTFLNEIKMKADTSASKRSSLSLTSFNLKVQEHQQNNNLEKDSPGAAENLKPHIRHAQQVSVGLKEIILDPLQFARMLHTQRFTHYEPLTKDLLYHEAHYGLLNKNEFRQLIIQDVLKRLSKLWQKSDFHIGSWVNALKIIDANWFVTFNGLEFDKTTVLQRLDEYDFRIKQTILWFNRNKNFNILYPSEYFNTNRKNSYEGGWMFTQQWWTSHLAKNNIAPQEKKKATSEAKRRTVYQNKVKRMRTKVRQVLANKITLADLFNYLDTSGFPEEIINMVPETIAYYEKLN
ncbi:hypothetical protein [Bizionia myxarmorum]|uniref:Uncharacterized protein n=1 Tax=Bizionia myxarmorum TaxID=291186 RepID=A0A5D0RAD6_9FLAO|nr:hypothetical protein [Bizionia myxarmorum]TYB78313.1 hypothetical protein ES674_00605 [Bizionia myxarmorum]